MSATIGETATLAHGYTMAEIDDIARSAVRIRKTRHMDLADAKDAAWHGVVEMLYDTAERPERFQLINAGVNAVQDVERENIQAHGVNRALGAPGPRFTRYWAPIASATDDFTERIVERLALHAVLGQLTDLEYEAIATLAALGDRKAAAAHLGVSLGVLDGRLRCARHRATTAWLAPESPVRRTRANKDQQCRYGHARAEHSYKSAAGLWVCRRCERNRARRNMATSEGREAALARTKAHRARKAAEADS